PKITDGGHAILDCRFAEGLDDPAAIARAIDATGALAHGLFLDMATEVIIASPDGVLRRARPPQP
ncbi:ribose-5-phosphate isomerase A, partial [Myxococcota bacterium]|nr:ribose-5-phosphate isomerase A [Myxococcota bacterium]